MILRIVAESAGKVLLRASLESGRYVIGREPDADIVLDDATVSRHHARLSISDEAVVIEDLGSENGTLIDGQRIDGSSWLYARQKLQIGSVAVSAKIDPLEGLDDNAEPYTVGEYIGSGGMGTILEARQTTLGRKVAMKVMLRPDDESAARRFVDEARITGVLEHPNIIPVHDLGVGKDGRLFYTMKFVRGRTLAEVIRELRFRGDAAATQYPLGSLLTTFQKVCDAVAFAHSQGVYHRDLKPENIMLGDYGEVVVMDWGLARDESCRQTVAESDEPALLGHTMEGSIVGTPEYMSPEQARGENDNISQRSDIYGLGAILHELLYLKPPVTGHSRLEIIDKVARGARDPVERVRHRHLPGERVPPALAAVARKATSLKPTARYQSVKELQREVEAYQNGFATAAQQAGLPTLIRLFVQRHRGASVAAFTGVCALFGAWAFFTNKVLHERDRAVAAEGDAANLLTKAEQERDRAVAAETLAGERLEVANAANAEAKRMREEAERERDQAQTERERSEKLLQNARDALAETDRVEEILARLSEEYVESGKIAEGLASLERALALVPDNKDLLIRRANLLQASGRFREAIPAYQEILELGPSPSARENLSLTERLQAEKEAASGLTENIRTELEKALEAQGRAREILALDAVGSIAESPREEPQDPAPEVADAIKRLHACAKLPGWRNDRVEKLPDGTLGLDLSGLGIDVLPPLRGLDISKLNLRGNPIADLSPLQPLRLRELEFAATDAEDLRPLRKMKLERLVVGPNVKDLRPLSGMPVKHLNLSEARVDGLAPLEGMPLEELYLGRSESKDLLVLVGMPLRHLNADRAGIKDWSALGALQSLESLTLPPRATGIDFSGLRNLRSVWCSRFSNEWLSGDVFRQMYASAEKAWQEWSGELLKLKGRDIGPQLISVSRPEGFDLNLDGTGISDLGPLANVPIYSLRLDSRETQVDLQPLGRHRSLRRLAIPYANAPAVTPLVDTESKLESLLASPASNDIAALAQHPTLQYIGYQPADAGWTTLTTREQFFGQRETPLDPTATALAEFHFDQSADQSEGWQCMDSRGLPVPVAWFSDAVAEGGRGGGCIGPAWYARSNDATFLVAPDKLVRVLPSALGGVLTFDHRRLRLDGPGQPIQVILRSDSRTLVRQLHDLPVRVWRRQVVPLVADGEWRLNEATGRPVNSNEFRAELSKVKTLRLQMNRGEQHGTPAAVDDIALIRPENAAEHLQTAEEDLAKMATIGNWLSATKVATGHVDTFAAEVAVEEGWDVGLVNGHTVLKGFEDRGPALLLRPQDADTPATLEIALAKVTSGGTLKVIAKAFKPKTVQIKVMHRDDILLSEDIGLEWTEVSLPVGSLKKKRDPLIVQFLPLVPEETFCMIEFAGIEETSQEGASP